MSSRKLHLVAVTGYRNQVDRLREAGFERHLMKPADLKKLSTWLAEWEHDAASNRRS